MIIIKIKITIINRKTTVFGAGPDRTEHLNKTPKSDRTGHLIFFLNRIGLKMYNNLIPLITRRTGIGLPVVRTKTMLDCKSLFVGQY